MSATFASHRTKEHVVSPSHRVRPGNQNFTFVPFDRILAA